MLDFFSLYMSAKRETTSERMGLFWRPAGRFPTASREAKVAQNWLVSWLNMEGAEPEVQRQLGYTEESVARIRKLFEMVQALVKIKIRDEDEERADLWMCFQNVDKIMRDYAIFPTLNFQPSSQTWAVMRRVAPTNPFSGSETLAAHGILELARLGLLNHVRQCSDPCNKWYFAKRDDAVACGNDTCRRRVYDRQPEVKEKRKKQAKDNAAFHTGKLFLKRKKD